MTDGALDWEGHEIVAYVNVTDPLPTLEAYKKWLLSPDSADIIPRQFREQILNLEKEGHKEMQDEYYANLAKKYYKGIRNVPKDLKVDIILVDGCPIGGGGSYIVNDIRTAIVNHLKPGGKFYTTFSFHSERDPYDYEFKKLFVPRREEKERVIAGDTRHIIRNEGMIIPQNYSIYTRKEAGGRRKTRKSVRRRHRTNRR